MKRLTRRSMLQGVLAGAMGTVGLGLVAGCGSPAASPDADGASQTAVEPEKAPASKVRIVHGMFPQWVGITGDEPDKSGLTYLDWPKHVAAQYTSEHPEVEIECVTYEWGDGQKKLYIQAAAGQGLPDIVYQPATYMKRLVEAGVVEEVTPFLTDADREDFVPRVLERNSLDGKLFGWPWLTYTSANMVNMRVVQERGAEDLLPSNDDRVWDHDAYLAAAEALTFTRDDGTEVYGFGAPANWTAEWLPYAWGYGARIFDEAEGTRIVMNGPAYMDAWRQALGFFDLAQSQTGVMPPGLAGMSFGDLSDMFLTGKLAMLPAQLPYYRTWENALAEGKTDPEVLEMHPVMWPSSDGIPPAPYIEEGLWVVFRQKDSGRIPAVMDYGHFLSNTENSRAVKAMTTLACRKSALEGQYGEDAFMSYMMRVSDKWSTPDLFTKSNVVGGFFGLETPLDAMLQSVLAREAGIDEAIEQGTARCQTELDNLLKLKELKDLAG